MFREVRLWNTTIMETLIQDRHRQVNPLTNNAILYYARLASGDYKIYDYASARTGKDVFSTPTDLIYWSDPTVTICAPHLYYYNKRCFLNPYTSTIMAVLPDFDTVNSDLSWIVTTNYS